LKRKNGWPIDRDVLFNGKRKEYHTGPKPDYCVFCEAREKGVGFDSLVLFQNKNFMAILNKFPYHIGHIMLMPARHIGKMEDLKDKEYIDLQLAIRASIAAVQNEYEAQGMNMGINLGKAAGAGIPGHLHYHVIPRWPGDVNFFPSLAHTRVISEDLEETYKRLVKPLTKELKKIK
jgi:ATP adenylyltransferase